MNILKNKYFILGNILLLLAIIPLTLFIVKRQTDLRSKAAPTTNFSFQPAALDSATGQTFDLDVYVDPGQNVISIIEFTVNVDPDFLSIEKIEKNAEAFPQTLKETPFADGTAGISMSTSNDVQKAIQTKTKAATITFKALKATTDGAATVIKFDKPPSQAFSLASSDGATENVLDGVGTASVTITGEATVSPGVSPALSPSPSASGSGSQNQSPVCTALTLDHPVSGPAPYSVIFTAAGSDANGTVSNVSFNFGDGPAQVVTSGGGVGTNNVNVQIAHTYTNPGIYSATATLSDNNGALSNVTSCSKTITVTAAAASSGGTNGGGTGGSTGGSGGAAQPTPTLPVTGTLETTLAIIGGTAIIFVVGAFLFIL